MSLREKQQMNLDTEGATYTGMECPSRSSHKYLLLQVWCGLLTMAMVVMVALLTSIKLKSAEDERPTLKPDVSPTVNTNAAPLKSMGSSPSYIQLKVSLDRQSRLDSHSCQSCSLILHNNSIHCTKDGLYFIYAQVTFSKHSKKNQNKSVSLKRNATFGKSMQILVEGIFPHTTEDTVWVAKIVFLSEGDSVSLSITHDFLTEGTLTFWGAFQLH